MGLVTTNFVTLTKKRLPQHFPMYIRVTGKGKTFILLGLEANTLLGKSNQNKIELYNLCVRK